MRVLYLKFQQRMTHIHSFEAFIHSTLVHEHINAQANASVSNVWMKSGGCPMRRWFCFVNAFSLYTDSYSFRLIYIAQPNTMILYDVLSAERSRWIGAKIQMHIETLSLYNNKNNNTSTVLWSELIFLVLKQKQQQVLSLLSYQRTFQAVLWFFR